MIEDVSQMHRLAYVWIASAKAEVQAFFHAVPQQIKKDGWMELCYTAITIRPPEAARLSRRFHGRLLGRIAA